MNTLTMSFKKEYWEQKNILLGLPLGFASILIVAALIAFIFIKVKSPEFNSDSITYSYENYQSGETLDFNNDLEVFSDKNNEISHRLSKSIQFETTDGDKNHNLSSQIRFTSFSFIAIFMTIGWFSGFVYLLSSLYSDRKDKTILFWKSLPIPEIHSVLAKLIMGGVIYTGVALLAAWVSYLILFGIAQLIVSSIGVSSLGSLAMDAFSFVQLFIMPIICLFFGAILGAPLFSYIMMISAFAKRAPFFIGVLPIFAVSIVEHFSFNSSNFLAAIISYLPMAMFDLAKEASTPGELIQTVLVKQGMHIFMGLLIASAFISIAVWFRNNRFET